MFDSSGFLELLELENEQSNLNLGFYLEPEQKEVSVLSVILPKHLGWCQQQIPWTCLHQTKWVLDGELNDVS